MTSHKIPKFSVHNDVREAEADDRPIFQSITMNQHFRSSKFDESSLGSIENNNCLLPTEGSVLSHAQKIVSMTNGSGSDDRVVEPAETATVKGTNGLMDCDRPSLGASETATAAAAAAYLQKVTSFMVGREEAADSKEGPIVAARDVTLSSSLAANASLNRFLDAPETKGRSSQSESESSPKPLFITATEKNQQSSSSSTNPLSPANDNQEFDSTSAPTSSSTKGGGVVGSLMTANVLESPGMQPTSAVVAGGRPLGPVDTPHFVVVAIDFGTTMSGYAFSFVRDPSSIHMMRKWEGGDPGLINQKTPTILLLSPEGHFHSFGFTARDFYHDLDNKEAKRWLYFEKFKMELHYNTKLNNETPIAASNGKCYPAIKVFSHALRYFRDHALQELSDQSSTEILNEDIRWVITVPAIWKAPAKQFMRQAAYEAGVASPDHPDQLLIALEPEAASIYVRRLKVYQLLSPSDSSSPVGESIQQLTPPSRGFDDDITPSLSLSPDQPSSSSPVTDIPRFDDVHSSPERRTEVLQLNLRLFDSLPRQRTVGLEMNDEGTRYMVVDCGGGTVDITVHEMGAAKQHGYLLELYKATGGPFGSVGVDLAFESLLREIFGSEFIESFRTRRPAGWVDLMTAFESRKRAASPYKDNSLNISLPFSFIDYYKKTKGHQIESAISKYNDQGVRWSSQGMLRLTLQAMKRLFHSTIESIKQAIGNVLNTVKDIRYLFLVGGFAESAILQHEIRQEFSRFLKILIPQDVALTILKGAVCFGLDPTVVTVRRSRMTYGVEVLNRFNAEKHPKTKLVRKDGIDWCTEVFDLFVSVDQPMALGDTVVRKYAPAAKVGQKTCVINIFSSEKSEVKFVTDVGVTKCGTLTLRLTDDDDVSSDGGMQAASKLREIQAVMTFGDTEIKVDAVDVTTGRSVGASIDFLN